MSSRSVKKVLKKDQSEFSSFLAELKSVIITS